MRVKSEVIIPDGFECVLDELEGRLALAVRPTHGQDIEAGGVVEQAFSLEKVESQAGETLLLGEIHGGRRVGMIGAFRRADLDEDDAGAVEGDNIQFTQLT